MGIVYKQSSRTTVISYLGVVIGYLNVLWLFPAILSAEQIGLIRLLPSIAFILLPFAQLGLSQSVLKFYPEYGKKKNGQNELFSFMLFASLVGFGLTLIILKVFDSQIEGFFTAKSALANEYMYVAIVLIFILSYHTIFESFSKSILKIIFPGIVKDVVIRLLYTLIVSLFFLDLITFSQVVNSLIIIYTLALLLLVSYVVKRTSLKLSLKFISLQSPEFKSICRYSIFTLLGASGSYIMLNIDQIMISNLIGLEGNGIYTTAFFIAIVIEMPRRAIANIATPIVSKLFAENKLNELNILYKQVSINQMLVGSLLLLGILVNLKNLFGFIPNNETYLAGMNVVYIIGLAKLVDMTFSMNGEIIIMSKYFKYNVLFTSLLAVIAIVSNIVLIPRFEIEGAAFATGLTLIIFNLLKLIFVKTKLQLWPFSWKNVILAAVALITYAIVNQIPFFSNAIFDLFFRSLITTIIFMTPCLLLRLSPEINSVITKITGIKI